MSNWYITPSNSDLVHHGVLGMKWGIRRYQNKDGSLTSAGRKHYGYSDKSNISNEKKYGLYEQFEKDYDPKSIKEDAALGLVGEALLATMSLGLGMYYLPNGSNIDKIDAINRAKKVYKEIDNNTNIDKKSGLKLKNKELSEKDDMKMVNPLYGLGGTEIQNNCGLCSITYSLRRQGYDVTVGTDAKGMTTSDIYNMFKNGKKNYEEIAENRGDKRLTKERAKSVVNKISSDYNNTNGIICVSWYPNGGHAINYKVENGTLTIQDTQSMHVFKKNEVQKLFERTKEVEIIRTDNLTPDFDKVKGVIMYERKDTGKI